MSPICNTRVSPKNKEKDPNKLRITENSAGRGPFSRHRKRLTYLGPTYFKAYFNLRRTVNPIGLSSPPNFLENYKNRTAKNSVIVRPLKVNWAVCINLINNVSKVITNNQSINSLS